MDDGIVAVVGGEYLINGFGHNSIQSDERIIKSNISKISMETLSKLRHIRVNAGGT